MTLCWRETRESAVFEASPQGRVASLPNAVVFASAHFYTALLSVRFPWGIAVAL